jgi:hypothetical protein
MTEAAIEIGTEKSAGPLTAVLAVLAVSAVAVVAIARGAEALPPPIDPHILAAHQAERLCLIGYG